MKKTFILVATIFFFISCKEEPKEQIRLGDYNHQEMESAVQKDTIAETVPQDSTTIEAKKDTTNIDSSKVVSDEKMVEEGNQ